MRKNQWAIGATVLLVASCAASDRERAAPTDTRQRIAGLRARFGPALPLGAAMGDATGGRVLRHATVRLPSHGNEMAFVEDDRSQMRLGFALDGAAPVAMLSLDGIAVYPHALDGADVLHRVHPEGTEDFVVFESRPSREELRYHVDVSRVPGLRLVNNVLELVDERGAPRLRVAPPYVVGADRSRTSARIAVDGCAYDSSPSAPWGRPIVRPGRPTCTVRIAWKDAIYPAVVDPSWTTTATMTTPRSYHSATKLDSGLVLIAGGDTETAELFDGVDSFAATGSMPASRRSHTATLLDDGRVLLTGGVTHETTATALLYSVTAGTFSPTGSMASRRQFHQAVKLTNGKVLVLGGGFWDTATNTWSTSATAELFETSSFTSAGSMATPRHQFTATLLPSGKVLVAGGQAMIDGAKLSSAELFDGVTFAPTGSMTEPRVAHAAAALPSGKVLLAGGVGSGILGSAELFDGVSMFTPTGSMATRRYNTTATVLDSGGVLFAGGDTDGPTDATEIFHTPGDFTMVGRLGTRRQNHTATLLDSGAVLVAGGQSAGPLASAEVMSFASDGAACAVAADCLSGICDDGICCATACPNGGVCNTCSPVTGACAAVKNADDPDTCHGTSTCDSAGACVENVICTDDARCLAGFYCDVTGHCHAQKSPGEACNVASDCKVPPCRACPGGICVDGVCCDAACKGQCEACDLAGLVGKCSPVTGPPHGRPPCQGDGAPCGQCDGKKVDGCTYLPEATVCKASCDGAVETRSACDGKGTCVAQPASSCPDNLACDPASNACRRTCEGVIDCAPGFVCAQGACVPPTSTCDGDHTTTDSSGKQQDCAPYTCESGGGCRRSCRFIADCSSPNICDSTQKCIPPTDLSATPTGGGCAAAPDAQRGDPSATSMLLIGLSILLYRRRA